MFIQTEQTPNPSTLKFIPGEVVLENGTMFFESINDAEQSPLAQALFKIQGYRLYFSEVILSRLKMLIRTGML